MFDEARSRREEFLSEEDLAIAEMSHEELAQTYNAWRMQAQSTNDADEDEYSHGVFVSPARAQQFWDDAEQRK